jgi:hypothetical protein
MNGNNLWTADLSARFVRQYTSGSLERRRSRQTANLYPTNVSDQELAGRIREAQPIHLQRYHKAWRKAYPRGENTQLATPIPAGFEEISFLLCIYERVCLY